MNPTTKQTGFIYVIWAKGTSLFKIGHSFSPESRRREIQTSNGHKVQIVFQHPGTSFQEKLIHKQFDEYRTEGEWFSFPLFGLYSVYRAIVDVHQKEQTDFPWPVSVGKTKGITVEVMRASKNRWLTRLRIRGELPRVVSVEYLTNDEYRYLRRSKLRFNQYKEKARASYNPGCLSQMAEAKEVQS